jgi:hypothetical protein
MYFIQLHASLFLMSSLVLISTGQNCAIGINMEKEQFREYTYPGQNISFFSLYNIENLRRALLDYIVQLIRAIIKRSDCFFISLPSYY